MGYVSETMAAALPCWRELHPGMIVRTNPIDEQSSELRLSVRTTSAEWSGDRSDIHDLISLCWAAGLRVREVASAQLYVILNPATGEEDLIYARPLLLPRLAIVPVDAAPEIEDALRFEAALAYHLMDDALGLHKSYGRFEEPEWSVKPSWLGQVCGAVGVQGSSSNYNVTYRELNGWTHFRAWRKDVSIAEIGVEAATKLREGFEGFAPARSTGVTREVFRSERFVNAVPFSSLKLAENLTAIVDGSRSTGGPMIVPLDSHVIAIGERSIAAVPGDCSPDAFAHEKQLVDRRRDAEAKVFLADAKAVWSEQIDEGRLQALVRDLVTVEPGVAWVREVGGVYEPDAGRDLIADWYVGPDRSRYVRVGAEDSVRTPRRVLIQVKSRRRGVGRDDARDLYDTLRQHGCDGLLFVAYPRVTTALFDKLDNMHSDDIWVDWWESSELERRLRERPDIGARFTDLVNLVRD
jgi:hypothetical protein